MNDKNRAEPMARHSRESGTSAKRAGRPKAGPEGASEASNPASSRLAKQSLVPVSIFNVELPSQWKRVALATHYRITKKPRELKLDADESLPFIPMEAVPVNGQALCRFELRKPAEIASGVYFEAGDILLSKITPSFENGKQGLASGLPRAFGYGSTEIIPLQACSDSAINLFLFYLLLHHEIRASLASKMEGSTGRKRVPEGAVRELEIPLPPKPEQQNIAAILWKLQRAIATQDRLLKATRDLKQSAMQRLFTCGLRGEPLKDTEIGLMPESWNPVPFSQLREFLQYGTSSKCGYQREGRPVIRIPNIVDGRVDTTDMKWAALTAKEIDSYELASGDLLFIRTNGVIERIGACAVFHDGPVGALFASYLIRARPNGKLHPEFFQYYSMTAQGRAQLAGRASAAADGKFNINTQLINSVLVPLPEIEEQRDIAATLTTIDRKLAHHQRKRVALDALFQTTLHQLMTAQVRVADLEIDTSEVADQFPDTGNMVVGVRGSINPDHLADAGKMIPSTSPERHR